MALGCHGCGGFAQRTTGCCAVQVFCGILSRVWQFSDILKDARAHHHQQQQQLPSQQQLQQQQQCHQVILGDLNTMAHSVARLSPNYCCDRLRWGSLGCCEAAWWQRNVLAVTGVLPHGISNLSFQYQWFVQGTGMGLAHNMRKRTAQALESSGPC
jgi:hypothetical protein